MSSKLSTLFLLLGAATAWAGNGDPIEGHPSYRERAVLALTNACRHDPQAYRAAYLDDARIRKRSNYPPTHALYWTLPLGRSSREHSEDMAETPCFQHDSCDGTSLWDRIQPHYAGATSMAETIASGYETPLDVVNGWLLDGGARALSHGAGHRTNMLAAKFTEMGAGTATGGPMRTYDTQDFGNGRPDFATPLVSGAHVIADGRITFLASWDGADAPREARVELDGEEVPMALAFGSGAHGTWRLVQREGDE